MSTISDLAKIITITAEDAIHSYSEKWFFNIKNPMLIKDSIWIMCTNAVYQFSICYHVDYFSPSKQLSTCLHLGGIFDMGNNSSGDVGSQLTFLTFAVADVIIILFHSNTFLVLSARGLSNLSSVQIISNKNLMLFEKKPTFLAKWSMNVIQACLFNFF